METGHPENPATHPPSKRSLAAFIWIISALLVLYPVSRLLNGSFPIFTFFFLSVPLAALIFSRDPAVIGIRTIRWSDFFKYTGLCLAANLAITAAVEPWSHTYQILLQKGFASASVDTTFGWLVRFPSPIGWVFFILFAGLVTIFAEELFFRGWLQISFMQKMKNTWAVILQATLFTLPQLLAASLLPLTQGILYGAVYSWLTIGLIGGWAASRTRSIWPSLVSATLYNLIMCLLIFPKI
jgi:membrane protease YdiL (CAAX protease family)